MDGSNMKLPPIELTVVSTKEFADSKLHMKNAVETSVPDEDFDFCAENGGYPPTQNGDIRSLFWLFSLMALQN